MDNSMSTMSGGSSTGETGRPMEQVREQTREAVQQGKEMATKAVDQARTQIKSQLSSQKDQLAGSIDGIAQALRTTGQQLDGNGQQANLSPFVDRAAEMVETFSGYLREHDLEDLVVDVENVARRNPAVFMGAAFAVGFVMARFLKSNGDAAYETEYRGGVSRHPEDVHRGYDVSQYRTARMGRPLQSSYDRVSQGEAGWSAASSPARETPTMTQPAMTDSYVGDIDEADDTVGYSRTIQE